MHTEETNSPSPIRTQSKDFIRTIIAEDLQTNKHGGRVTTRFPPA